MKAVSCRQSRLLAELVVKMKTLAFRSDEFLPERSFFLDQGLFMISELTELTPQENKKSFEVLCQDAQEGQPVAFSWMEAHRADFHCRTKTKSCKKVLPLETLSESL